MNIEQFRDYCLSKPQTTEDFPFDQNTLVFKVVGKMFALAPLDQWEKGLASVNLKANPDYSVELRLDYKSIKPGFHMNKNHWNTIFIHQGEIPPKFIKELIDHSYDMVIKTMSKKLRDTLT